MEDTENKAPRRPTPSVREDSANRAKNRTVILDSNVTGSVRARLGGELQGISAAGRIGGLESPAGSDDPHWESPRISSEVGVRKAPGAVAAEPVQEVDQGSLDLAKAESVPVGDSYVAEAAVEEVVVEEAVVQPTEAMQPEPQFAPVDESQSTWDPLPFLADTLAEQAANVEGAPERTPFIPDSPPEFFHVVEEPMLTEAEPRAEEIYWKACTQLVGFLVSFDYESTGSYLELRTGRLLVSAQPDPASNCLVLNHESVSPSHAVLRVATGGAIQVLDQLSESGTRIRKFDTGEEILLSGDKMVLNHGDVVSFGDRNFHVCLIMGNSSQG